MEEKQLKYYKMHHDLEEQIHRGELRAGDRVPSENQLAAVYQVSRQTVRKALAILEQEGYIYAMHGKGTFVSERLRPGHKSHNIAVVTTYLSDYIFPRVIQGIDDVLTAEGYSILLKNTHNSRSQEARCLEELLQKDIDGVIIEPSKSQISCRHLHLYEQLESYGIPYVFIQGCFDRMEDRPQVLMDDCRGGYMITKYLLDNGHRSIAGIFKADDIQGQNRHRGYVQALQEAGMLYDPDKVIWFHTEDRKVHPREGILRLLARGFHWMPSYAITIRSLCRSFRHWPPAGSVFRRIFLSPAMTIHAWPWEMVFTSRPSCIPRRSWERWPHSCCCLC